MSFWKKLFGGASNSTYVIRLKEGNRYVYLPSGVGRKPVSDPKDAWTSDKNKHTQIAAFLRMDRQAFSREIAKSRDFSALGSVPSESRYGRRSAERLQRTSASAILMRNLSSTRPEVVALDKAIKDYNIAQQSLQGICCVSATSIQATGRHFRISSAISNSKAITVSCSQDTCSQAVEDIRRWKYVHSRTRRYYSRGSRFFTSP